MSKISREQLYNLLSMGEQIGSNKENVEIIKFPKITRITLVLWMILIFINGIVGLIVSFNSDKQIPGILYAVISAINVTCCVFVLNKQVWGYISMVSISIISIPILSYFLGFDVIIVSIFVLIRLSVISLILLVKNDNISGWELLIKSMTTKHKSHIKISSNNINGKKQGFSIFHNGKKDAMNNTSKDFVTLKIRYNLILSIIAVFCLFFILRSSMMFLSTTVYRNSQQEIIHKSASCKLFNDGCIMLSNDSHIKCYAEKMSVKEQLNKSEYICMECVWKTLIIDGFIEVVFLYFLLFSVHVYKSKKRLLLHDEELGMELH